MTPRWFSRSQRLSLPLKFNKTGILIWSLKTRNRPSNNFGMSAGLMFKRENLLMPWTLSRNGALLKLCPATKMEWDAILMGGLLDMTSPTDGLLTKSLLSEDSQEVTLVNTRPHSVRAWPTLHSFWSTTLANWNSSLNTTSKVFALSRLLNTSVDPYSKCVTSSWVGAPTQMKILKKSINSSIMYWDWLLDGSIKCANFRPSASLKSNKSQTFFLLTKISLLFSVWASSWASFIGCLMAAIDAWNTMFTTIAILSQSKSPLQKTFLQLTFLKRECQKIKSMKSTTFNSRFIINQRN